MIKRILLPLDDSQYADNAIELGSIIARKLDAELTGLVILDLPGIERSIGPVPMGAIHYAEKIEKLKIREAEDHIDELLARFEEKCIHNKVRFRKEETQGSPVERIIHESFFYDAIIMGMKTYYQFGTKAKHGESVEKVLNHMVTPVYTVPIELDLASLNKEKFNVLIAYDGSHPASRGLHRFAQLEMNDFFNITVLFLHDVEKEAKYLLDQVEAFLSCHGYKNVEMIWTEEDIIESIDSKYIEKTDFIIAGTHSKSNLFDFRLGSLAKHLLKTEKKPVFLYQ